jgi:hypothetical protein
MQRYQDLVDRHISQGNMQVLNMLNTKYFIIDQNSKPMAQQNPEALGNAWFVSQVETVPNADEEIAALRNFNAAKTAIVDERFIDHISTSYENDSLAQIKLTKYDPKRMEYTAKTSTKQLAVFSEIYYPEGWQATIDGKPAKHIRVNYILRALEIPAGEHSIVFEFRPKSYYTGRQIALGSSLILLLFVAFVFGKELKENLLRKDKE